jgi:hypothetical protein
VPDCSIPSNHTSYNLVGDSRAVAAGWVPCHRPSTTCVCVCVCVVSPIESEYSRGRTSSPRWQFRHPAKIIVGTTRVGFLDRTPASTKTKTRTTRKTPKEDRRFDPNSSSALLSTHTHTPREGALTILLNPLARFGCPMLALLRQCSYFYTIYRMKIR